MNTRTALTFGRPMSPPAPESFGGSTPLTSAELEMVAAAGGASGGVLRGKQGAADSK